MAAPLCSCANLEAFSKQIALAVPAKYPNHAMKTSELNVTRIGNFKRIRLSSRNDVRSSLPPPR
ncbi:hypothetical protein SBV1_1130020 [Verrucomicrobia bacterium]|nr:hypothetical protein SBV1_1130020 [Verrucomicrobiota bacterium]